MGGSALKNTVTRRMPAQEYQAWLQALSAALPPLLEEYRVWFNDLPQGQVEPMVSTRWAPIPCYRQKADFGDIDLLIERPVGDPGRMGPHLWEALGKQFHGTECHHNGPAWSWGARWSATEESAVQVDLIFVSPEEYECSLRYYSWNDLGNLMGRVAHEMGLVYGHRGLLLPVRTGTHLLDKVILTHDMDKAAQFLGYDPAPLHQGFDTLEEMFAYAASSEFFHPDLYALEHRSHTARTRDRKRSSYRGFLEWVHSRPLASHDWTATPSSWVDSRLAEWFPKAWDQAKDLRERAERIQEVRAVVGGGWLGPQLGLVNQDLGDAVERLRQHAPMEQWWRWWQEEGLDAVRARALLVAAPKSSRDKPSPMG
jgi:hypothetical protein